MAGKERAAACRMVVEEGVRPCMEGITAVGRHLPGAVLCQPSAGFKIRVKQQSRTCLGRAGRLRVVVGWKGVLPSCQVFT